MATSPPQDTKTGFSNAYSDPNTAANWQTNYGPPAGYQQVNYGMEPPPTYDNATKNPDGQGYDQGYGQPYASGYPAQQGPGAVVVQPGMMVVPQQPYADVPDHMCLSIVSLFFCLFIGIFSIMNSSNVRTLKAQGQYQTALVKARSAKNLAICAIVVGLILCALNIIIRVVLINNAENDDYHY